VVVCGSRNCLVVVCGSSSREWLLLVLEIVGWLMAMYKIAWPKL
jgi:hypothetical protein